MISELADFLRGRVNSLHGEADRDKTDKEGQLSHDHSNAPPGTTLASCCKEKRAAGVVWVFRWSERINGQRRHHKEVIGTLKEFKTESAASKAAEKLRFQLNENKKQLSPSRSGI